MYSRSNNAEYAEYEGYVKEKESSIVLKKKVEDKI